MSFERLILVDPLRKIRTILIGFVKRESVFIRQIPIIAKEIPFNFMPLQFPFRLDFATTINKSQGL